MTNLYETYSDEYKKQIDEVLEEHQELSDYQDGKITWKEIKERMKTNEHYISK